MAFHIARYVIEEQIGFYLIHVDPYHFEHTNVVINAITYTYAVYTYVHIYVAHVYV